MKNAGRRMDKKQAKEVLREAFSRLHYADLGYRDDIFDALDIVFEELSNNYPSLSELFGWEKDLEYQLEFGGPIYRLATGKLEVKGLEGKWEPVKLFLQESIIENFRYARVVGKVVIL